MFFCINTDSTSLFLFASSPLSIDVNGFLFVDADGSPFIGAGGPLSIRASSLLSSNTSPSIVFLPLFLTGTISRTPYSAFVYSILLFSIAGSLLSSSVIALWPKMKAKIKK